MRLFLTTNFILIMVNFDLYANPTTMLILDEQKPSIDPHPGLFVTFPSQTNQTNLEIIFNLHKQKKFNIIKKTTPNFGFSTDSHWLATKVVNPTEGGRTGTASC